MKCGIVGQNLIKKIEALKLKAYPCSAGVWTIGWGHTKGVKEGDTCTLCQAQKWFDEDIKWCEEAVNKYVKVDLTQNQFDMLCSFCFNTGASRFGLSQVVKFINQNIHITAPEAFKKRYLTAFITALGNPCKGLVNRRLAE